MTTSKDKQVVSLAIARELSMTYNDVCFVTDKEPASKEILLQQCSRYDGGIILFLL